MADKVMSKLLGSRKKRQSPSGSAPNDDPLEVNIGRNIRLFCQSGGPNNQDEEVLYLPAIVEAAESSPAATKEAATVIRKCLRDNYGKAHVQYNAVMLIGILADNPGKPFTRNIDAKFVATVKEVLREGRDSSVQQILRETLESFEASKADDETLAGLREMWKKEKTKHRGGLPQAPGLRTLNAPPFDPRQANYFARRPNNAKRGLPSPVELASRVEEAKTSANLLTQVLQSTPTADILGSEILKEFAERCQSASKSFHTYIAADNPAPDDDTMLTLIETNELLSVAVSRYQRGVLQARKALGSQSVSPSPSSPIAGQQGQAPSSPPVIPQGTNGASNPFLNPASVQAEPHLPAQPVHEQEPLPWDYSDPPPAALKSQPPLQPQIRSEVQYQPPSHPPPGQRSQPLQPQPPQLTTSTPSYVHRQESAIDHLNMHGANESPVSPALASGGDDGGLAQTQQAQEGWAQTQTQAQGQQSRPMYRY